MNGLLVAYIAAIVTVIALAFFAVQMANLVTLARSVDDNLQKATILLTVMANKQGATTEDVQRVVSK